ncbi:hypothetical protein DB30_01451 [Enhygromyxa salina]|uniref:Uncharacterized protein n=1 Tax=Enhygromyxa salina TaxID=215803 RepID=A0A0C1Z458_9BACT|nr:hypothetical protein DB30_01451 [Enhygromyxa salina]
MAADQAKPTWLRWPRSRWPTTSRATSANSSGRRGGTKLGMTVGGRC